MINNPSLFSSLSEELLLHIALESELEAIAKWSKTENRTKIVLEDENLWKNLLARDYKVILHDLPESYSSYKQYYIQCYSWNKQIKLATLNQKAELSELVAIYKLISPETIDQVVQKVDASTSFNLKLKQKLQDGIANYQYRVSQGQTHLPSAHSWIYKSFKKLAQIYFSVYKKNNLIAGFEFVKLYAAQHATPSAIFSIISIDSSQAYKIGIELIDKHFRVNQVIGYLRQILDVPGIYSNGEIYDRIRSKQKFIFNGPLVKCLTVAYPSKILIRQIQRLLQKDLELLMKVYLPFLISCPDGEIADKQKYEKLLQDLKTTKIDPSAEELTASELHSLLGLKYQEPAYFDGSSSESEFEEELAESIANINLEESDSEQNESHQFP